MNSTHLANASALIARQFKLINLQRVAVILLLLSLTATMMYARAEKSRAEQWRAEAICLQSQLSNQQATATPALAMDAVPQDQDRRKSRYYEATLIGLDDSQTPLTGKAIHVDLGGGRVIEIELERQEKDHLLMWAPLRRGDTHVNCVVFHPHCANSYALELDRIALRSDSSDAVAYKAR